MNLQRASRSLLDWRTRQCSCGICGWEQCGVYWMGYSDSTSVSFKGRDDTAAGFYLDGSIKLSSRLLPLDKNCTSALAALLILTETELCHQRTLVSPQHNTHFMSDQTQAWVLQDG